MPHTRYDPDADLNPEVLDLEGQLARKQAELDYFGRHRTDCPNRWGGRGGCICGWKDVQDGTLWDFVGDSEDLDKALASHEDDAVAERKKESA
ncbi:hypothetical protein LCGC14_0723120 [marine sediment metagenome]|uniref:Uncharacterized protein n=1 Tax=marine sediment metagenome TaxID=412755 RepID=A0A0F9SX38_9ZZZZ